MKRTPLISFVVAVALLSSSAMADEKAPPKPRGKAHKVVVSRFLARPSLLGARPGMKWSSVPRKVRRAISKEASPSEPRVFRDRLLMNGVSLTATVDVENNRVGAITLRIEEKGEAIVARALKLADALCKPLKTEGRQYGRPFHHQPNGPDGKPLPAVLLDRLSCVGMVGGVHLELTERRHHAEDFDRIETSVVLKTGDSAR